MPIDPLTAVAVGSQVVSGLGQLFGGLLSPKPQRPSLGGLQQNVQQAQSARERAMGRLQEQQQRSTMGLPASARAAMEANVRDAYRAGRLGADQLGAGQSAATNALLAQQRARQLNEIVAQNEMERDRQRMLEEQYDRFVAANEAALGQARQNLYGAEMQRFQQESGARSGLIGAGMQNIMGGLTSGASLGMYGNYLKSIMGDQEEEKGGEECAPGDLACMANQAAQASSLSGQMTDNALPATVAFPGQAPLPFQVPPSSAYAQPADPRSRNPSMFDAERVLPMPSTTMPPTARPQAVPQPITLGQGPSIARYLPSMIPPSFFAR